MWMIIHIIIAVMRTIQITIDAPLLRAVDTEVRRRRMTRSALIRASLQAALKAARTHDLEELHRRGYEENPPDDDLDLWKRVQAWPRR